MKKTICVLGTLSLILFTAYNVYSAAFTSAATDDTVTVQTTNITTAPDIVFQKSAQVIISGASDATNFAHGAYHSGVLGKKNGKRYGMTADVSKIFWTDISGATSAPAAISATTSAAFTGWNKM